MIFGYVTVFLGCLHLINEINMLKKFFIFSDLAQRRTPPVNYTISGHKYSMGYYINDDISKVGNFCETISYAKEIRENTFILYKS